MRNHLLKGAAIALALAGVMLVSAVTADAAVGVSFDIGNVAVGYSDGYIDTDHQYHPWAKQSEAVRFRTAHKDLYYGYLNLPDSAAGVSFDVRNVAVGYSDGYIDTDHQYHPWAKRSDAVRFRTAHKDLYYGYLNLP